MKAMLECPKWNIRLMIIIVLAVLFTGCQPKTEITISQQFGLAYLPVEIMKHKGFLSDQLEKQGINDKILWKKLPNTAAIRESMLSGDLDIAFAAIPPVILGSKKGMDWHIVTGISGARVGLVTKNPEYKDIRSIVNEDIQIILPQPGSIQHILLKHNLKQNGLDEGLLDQKLISMSHPDGVVAFKHGGVETLHFTTPPYLSKNLENDGAKEIVSHSADDFTFAVCIVTNDYFEDEDRRKALVAALEQAVDFINDETEEAVRILAENSDYSVEELTEHFEAGDIKFFTELKGMELFESLVE